VGQNNLVGQATAAVAVVQEILVAEAVAQGTQAAVAVQESQVEAEAVAQGTPAVAVAVVQENLVVEAVAQGTQAAVAVQESAAEAVVARVTLEVAVVQENLVAEAQEAQAAVEVQEGLAVAVALGAQAVAAEVAPGRDMTVKRSKGKLAGFIVVRRGRQLHVLNHALTSPTNSALPTRAL